LGTETKSYEEEKKISLKKVDEMKNTIDELKDVSDYLYFYCKKKKKKKKYIYIFIFILINYFIFR